MNFSGDEYDEGELPDLFERDREIVDKVLTGKPREHFVKAINQFAFLADYCDSDIEAAMCVGLCSVLADRMRWSREYIYPQFPVDPFRLDFLVWPDPEAGPLNCIGVECDGAAFHQTPRQQGYDAWRSRKILEDSGIPVIRFPGREIFGDAIGCAQRALDRAEECRRQGIVAHAGYFDRNEESRTIGELVTERLNELRGRQTWPA